MSWTRSVEREGWGLAQRLRGLFYGADGLFPERFLSGYVPAAEGNMPLNELAFELIIFDLLNSQH